MTTDTATDFRKQFYVSMAVINQLRSYLQTGGSAPTAVPHLTEIGAAKLSTSDGREVLRLWLRIFDDTLNLLDQVHKADLEARTEYSDDDLEQVADAAQKALLALSRRLNSLRD